MITLARVILFVNFKLLQQRKAPLAHVARVNNGAIRLIHSLVLDSRLPLVLIQIFFFVFVIGDDLHVSIGCRLEEGGVFFLLLPLQLV